MKPADECELDSYINSDCQGQGCEKWATGFKGIGIQYGQNLPKLPVLKASGGLEVGSKNTGGGTTIWISQLDKST
jgi:hypothetical protein